MTLMQEARYFVKSEFPGVKLDQLSDADVRGAVESLYTGGWESFRRIHQPGYASGHRDTHLATLARVRKLTGMTVRLGFMDEINDLTIKDDQVVLSVRCYELKEWRNRMRVTNSGIRLLAWRLHESGFWYKLTSVTSWDEDFEGFDLVGQYGRVMTQSLYDAREWQDEYCYRPGTKKTPMDGPYSLNPSLPQSVGEM